MRDEPLPNSSYSNRVLRLGKRAPSLDSDEDCEVTRYTLAVFSICAQTRSWLFTYLQIAAICGTCPGIDEWTTFCFLVWRVPVGTNSMWRWVRWKKWHRIGIGIASGQFYLQYYLPLPPRIGGRVWQAAAKEYNNIISVRSKRGDKTARRSSSLSLRHFPGLNGLEGVLGSPSPSRCQNDCANSKLKSV